METDARPNIVLITCHDLGRYLGCYGFDTIHTPAIDRIAETGVLLADAYCASPGCSPSRAALATGRYPHSNGVMGLTHPPFDWDLHPDEQHLAAILSGHGYETHLFGLQHVTTDVNRLGFDQVHTRGLGPLVSSEVSDFLGSTPRSSPFYLEINLEEPHRPYDQGSVEPDDSGGVYLPPFLPEGPETREEMAAFQGAVRAADPAVGRITSSLDAAGLTEDTLLVFTADHGIAMPRAKATLYDPGIEVALLLRWQGGGITGGRTCPGLVSNVDVLPTLLEAIRVPIHESVQGRSFLPLLRTEPYESRDCIYAEKTYHSYYDPMRCVRTDHYKLIRNFETAFAVEVPGDVQLGPIFRRHVELYHSSQHPPVEMYDLRSDPLETENVAGRPELAEVQDDLEARLLGWMQETHDPLLDGPIASPAYRRSLAALVEHES